MTINNKAVYSI